MENLSIQAMSISNQEMLSQALELGQYAAISAGLVGQLVLQIFVCLALSAVFFKAL